MRLVNKPVATNELGKKTQRAVRYLNYVWTLKILRLCAMSVPLLISFSFGIKPSRSGGLRTISVLDESRFVTMMCLFGREEMVALGTE